MYFVCKIGLWGGYTLIDSDSPRGHMVGRKEKEIKGKYAIPVILISSNRSTSELSVRCSKELIFKNEKVLPTECNEKSNCS